MVIHVPADLIEKAKSDISIAKTLKLLFWLFDSGKHSWFLRPSDDPEIFSIPLLASFQEFITKSITDDLYSHNNPTVLVRVCTPDYILERKKSFAEKRIEFKTFLDDKRLTAHDDFGNIHEFISIEIVETFLNRPLSIILENAESDGLFIKTCLKLIAGIDTEQCFLELVHGGGSTLPMVAENIKGLQRVVCIVDSDKISPIQTPNNKKGWIRNIKKYAINMVMAFMF
ncbi:MAG: hypothetical protein NHB14_15595 [Desulfosporosinus sp.]|nr:hypothetical protein [Desulfosporosinus sp.]